MRRLIKITLGITFLFFLQPNIYAQVGIGTTVPDASSILDITSDSQGMLTPRMTTIQRTGIASPAEGLLVFDIDEDAFYYFDSSIWVKLEGSVTRDNYKLVKSIADLSDELVGGKYVLNEDYLYEINGTIIFDFPIDLNGAYIIGEDTNEDILFKAGGTLFEGDSGGSIRGVTLVASGGTVFSLAGSLPITETLILRDCIIANSTSVGSISSFDLVFLSIAQFANNAGGITYTDINQLLINSSGWHGNNGGVYESFSGTFDVISRQGGFSEVIGATAAMDVTGVTSINGDAAIRNVSFFGGGNYINGSSPYSGYDFTNDWDVNSPGLPVETDGVAIGDINFDYPVGTGFATDISAGGGTGIPMKIGGLTTSNNLFRFEKVGNNRLVYDGKKTRYFSINTSFSFRGDNNNAIFIFYIAKGNSGDTVASINPATRVYREVGSNNDIGAVAIVGSIELSPGDFLEVWVERFSGSGDLLTVSLNMVVK
ncbi:hypothetical protein QLS71_017785 [Mariniflexile litorale]|uniref:Cell wall anchor protein n=1 Tax=Mariniflexile litorale TaxID=3045158 RepID=A0AAU7EFS7_9FLAO|nr:hypothetical protein [Mariniflexile sp. KMM 9835]MDQ8213119.1 hypothetical protein [Mariniflexile sp. KMM 9835]